ncbi:ATP-binding protein [uncultured Microbacterium sp.]|uniref:sensor histidine kinase n=1 Tax=uncultured Microbacterium sp. TaxID=191216 RepID=UPI0028D3168E|nr:ATP-binding protein [uncultured Microbacterium sp.]
MTTPAPLPIGTRTASIWQSQLLLSIVVVVIVLIVQALSPESLNQWTFTIGVSLVVVLTAVALALPWDRLPRWVVLMIPLLDIVAVGLMNRDTPVDFAFLWVFPVTWVASHFPLWATGTALGTVTVIVLLEEIRPPADANGTLRLIVVTLSLTFIAISTYSSSRQSRAFKRLLRREATKLNETLTRSTRQERELSRVLGSIDVGVVRLSADGEILEANKTYRDLYDIDPDDAGFAPRSVEYDGFEGDPLGNARRPIMRARRGEQFEDERTWLFTADWEWRALAVTALRLPDDSGLASGGSLVIAHDITAMISAERARASLATRVSHELRNPLTTILGFSDLLLEEPDVAGRTRDRVQAITSAAERMLTLANEILESGKRAQKAESIMTSTDLAKVVADSVESFAPAAEAGGIHVVLAVSEPVSVHGDAFRLRQVSDNLLSNAIKYTPKGGRVTVEVFRSSAKDGDAAAADQGVLVITDTGMGMGPDDLERIFEPYFRTAAAEASPITGTGLGMGIVRSLVDEHRGELSVKSELGRGTVATVSLPLDEGPDAAPPPPRAQKLPRETTDA